MSDIPDILGMELHDAVALLEAEGLAFIIVETKPVGRKSAGSAGGALRVVRVQPRISKSDGAEHTVPADSDPDKGFVLTVCRI